MYVPPAFAVDEEEALGLAEAVGFGVLVTPGLEAVHAPFVVRRDPLRLIAHVARTNPIWRSAAGEAVMIVQGPNTYVSPSFYPSKAEHSRVAPTWNYEAAHLRGAVTWFEDKARLRAVVEAATERFEAGRPAPWTVADAPADYLKRMLDAIVGLDLRITHVTGARKLSQNRNDADHAGVIDGLFPSPIAEAMRR